LCVPDRKFPGNLRKDQVIIDDIPPLQDLLVKEAQCGYAPFDGAWGKFPVFEQVKLEAAYLLAAQALRRFTQILRKLRDGENVGTRSVFRIVAAQFVQYPLTSWGHRNLLSVTETTAAYASEHARHCVRRASGLVSSNALIADLPGAPALSTDQDR
jgi:hypothetical protein